MVCGNITRCSNSGHVCDYLCIQKRFLYYWYWELFLHYSGKRSSHKCKLWVFGLPSVIYCVGLCQRHYGAGLHRWDTSVIIYLLCCFHLDPVWERERESFYGYRHSFCYIYTCCRENNKAVTFYYCWLSCMSSMFASM